MNVPTCLDVQVFTTILNHCLHFCDDKSIPKEMPRGHAILKITSKLGFTAPKKMPWLSNAITITLTFMNAITVEISNAAAVDITITVIIAWMLPECFGAT